MPSKYTNPTVDNSTLSGRTQPIEWPHEHISSEAPPVTGLGDGTDYFYFDMNTYPKFGVQLEYDGGTAGVIVFTVEGSLQNDGTAQASCSYDDYTIEFGAVSFTTVAGAVDKLTLIDTDGALSLCRYVRIKYVVTGASADVDITAHKRSTA